MFSARTAQRKHFLLANQLVVLTSAHAGNTRCSNFRGGSRAWEHVNTSLKLAFLLHRCCIILPKLKLNMDDCLSKFQLGLFSIEAAGKSPELKHWNSNYRMDGGTDGGRDGGMDVWICGRLEAESHRGLKHFWLNIHHLLFPSNSVCFGFDPRTMNQILDPFSQKLQQRINDGMKIILLLSALCFTFLTQ